LSRTYLAHHELESKLLLLLLSTPELFELRVGLLQQLVQLLEAVVPPLLKGFRWQAAQVLDLALQLCALALQRAALAHQRLQSFLFILQTECRKSQAGAFNTTAQIYVRLMAAFACSQPTSIFGGLMLSSMHE